MHYVKLRVSPILFVTNYQQMLSAMAVIFNDPIMTCIAIFAFLLHFGTHRIYSIFHFHNMKCIYYGKAIQQCC